MLRIRFSRVGKKNAPSFRLVLTPQGSPPKGKFLEILGFYNPRTKEKGFHKERILHWISQGAQPSDTAHNFLIREGVIEGKKVSVHSTAKRKKEEATEKAPVETPTDKETPTESTEEKSEGETSKEAPTEKAAAEDASKEETPASEEKPETSPAEETPEVDKE